jgi:magnesium chelatase subunit I
LNEVPGLRELVKTYMDKSEKEEAYFFMEFALHGLAEFSLISKKNLEIGLSFKDLLSSMFSAPGPEDEADNDLLSDLG